MITFLAIGLLASNGFSSGALSFHLDQKGNQEVLAHRLKAAEAFYSKLKDSSGLDILADVSIVSDLPPLPAVEKGRLQVLVAAQAGRRRWEQVGDVQVFCRRSEDAFGSSRRDARTALGYLASLPDSDLRLMSEGEFFDDRIPPEIREQVLMAITPSPSDLPNTLGPTSRTRLQLDLTLSIEIPSKSGGKSSWQSIPVRFAPSTEPHPPASKVAKVDKTEPLRRSEKGPIVFEPGQVMKLSELIGKMRPHLTKPITYDFRLAESYYYVGGKFTETGLIDALKRVTKVDDLVWGVQPGGSVDAMISGLFDRLNGPALQAQPWINRLGFSRVRQGGKVQASEIMAASPYLRDLLMKSGVDENALVNIRPAVSIGVDPGGTRTDSTGQKWTKGFVYVIQ